MQPFEDSKHDITDSSVLSTSSDPNAITDYFPFTRAVHGSVEPHIFTNPARADHRRKVYEASRYEGRHRFDPSFQWTASEEKKAIRKLDWRIMLLVWAMYSSLDLVRRNINRAISDNMLDDLGIDTNDFNTGQTIYLVLFHAAELPGGLISKKVGPFRYTPAVIVLWGGISMAQAGMNSRWSFWLLRALLGLAQGGFIPEMILYLSYFYKSSELSIRMSWFYTGIPLTQAWGSLLAGGILEMRGMQGWGGWQWLFLLEGLICVLIGIVAYFVMSPSITEPALAFNKKDGTNKWWTDKEELILVNRLLRDDPTKGDLNNRTAVSFKEIVKTIVTPHLLPIYIVGLFAWIPFQPTANYLSLTLRNLGYSVFEANVLTIPSYMLFAFNGMQTLHTLSAAVADNIQLLLFGWLSERFNERFLIGSCSNLWMLPFFIGLISIGPDANPWVRYALLTGINSLPYAHSIVVGLVSRNSMSVGRRAVACAVYNMTYQIGSIVSLTTLLRNEVSSTQTSLLPNALFAHQRFISSISHKSKVQLIKESQAAVNIYREEDAPLYYTAKRGLVGMCCGNICLFIAAKLYYVWRNRRLEARLADLPESEKSATAGLRFAH